MRQPLRALAVVTASLSLAGGAIAAAAAVSAHPARQVVIPTSATPTHDPTGHDANDDHGGNRPSSSVSASSGRGGADDPATHDANDDHGGSRSATRMATPTPTPTASSGRDGSDDPAGHDADDDDSPRATPTATESDDRGSDDPADHDAGDDHGGSHSGRH